jgi:N-methylhydantoinase A
MNRLSIDVGGTFTDLVADTGDGSFRLFKAPTSYPDPIDGVIAVIEIAAADQGQPLRDYLTDTEFLFHSTTRAINAVITGRTARTGLLVSKGHPDILLLREGGRTDPFDYSKPFPEPYIPRSLTFEVPGRIWADGREIAPLDEAALASVIAELKSAEVEAVAVSLLWSIVNPAHELAVGAALAEALPGIPFTLSHQLNPTVREYRRTSATAIDASLKPVMTDYLTALGSRLAGEGMRGEVFAVTSQGGLVSLADMAAKPILALNSGPSMAPVAGRRFAEIEQAAAAIVTDAGGTTYDVSLVRDGVIPWTRETWLGGLYQGHLTGFPSVDVKSVGAGGGSIASVTSAGLLRVGPESAGSTPGPVCYGRGGTKPTVTDAAVVLGYIDPGYFLGGRMALAVEEARAALLREVAEPLGLTTEEAALAVIDLATEHMVNAIEDITVKQGIDPAGTVLVAGGGAAGLNTVLIARRLGCGRVIVPDVAPALSAAGAMMSDLTQDFTRTYFMRASAFDRAAANRVLGELRAAAQAFFAAAGEDVRDPRIDLSIEGRYPSQVWETEVPLRRPQFEADGDVADLVADFHDRHRELFSFRDDGDEVEIMSWRAVARCRVNDDARMPRSAASETGETLRRRMVFPKTGAIVAPAFRLGALNGAEVIGPAVIESNYTTVVIQPGARARRQDDGHLVIEVAE